MTNEEITEEIYYEAHKHGFIDQLHDAMEILRMTHPKLTRYEMVYTAYYDIIKKMGLPPFGVD